MIAEQSIPTSDTRLESATDLARALTGIRGLDAVLDRSAQAVREALDAETVSVVLWAGERAGDGADPRARTATVGPVSRVEEATPGQLPPPTRPGDNETAHTADTETRALDLRNQIVVPIEAGSRAVGQLQVVAGPDRAAYTAADREFARLLAAELAAVLDQAEQVERLERLAFQDALTGLANRRALDEALGNAIDQHRRLATVVSLVVCDLNGLKRLNDECGHEAGDQLLVQFARTLAEAAATLPGALAARLGGDEFCVLVLARPADAAARLAEEVCQRALALPAGEGVACGVASTGDPVGPVTTAARLFRLADAAQYRAKRTGVTAPVVAGRGYRPDVTVEQMEEGLERRVSRDRRLFRGAHVDPGLLLTTALRSLGSLAPGSAAPLRLEAVARTAATVLDADSWRLSYVPSDGQLLTPVATGVRPGDQPPAVGPEPVNLEDYPVRAGAVHGGSYDFELGRIGNDVAEEAACVRGGHQGVVAAGVCEPGGGGWLVEIHTGTSSPGVRDLGPVLHALLAVALTGGEPPVRG